MTTFGPYQATVVNIHDGDTIDVDILLAHVGRATLAHPDQDLGFDVHRTVRGIELKRQPLRLYGCNAPELATPAGKQALVYIETLIKVGDTVTVISHGWDKYGQRIDAEVKLGDGRDLTEAMIAANQAAAWDGKGPKPVPQVAA